MFVKWFLNDNRRFRSRHECLRVVLETRVAFLLLLLSAPVKVNESREQESMADLLGGDHREPPQSDAVAEANQRVALETSSSPFFFIL